MEIFKQVSREKTKFQTSKGLLSAEQLWDLSLEDLDDLAVSLEADHKQSAKKSFLVKSSSKDKTAKLKFDVVIEILNTKVAEKDAAIEAMEIKAHNKKIIELISEKQDESLKGKSIKQLEAMLK